MDYLKSVSNLTPEVISQLKLAVEIGRWENGEQLTPSQLDSAMQAIIIWDAQHNESNEAFKANQAGELVSAKPKVAKVKNDNQILVNLIDKE